MSKKNLLLSLFKNWSLIAFLPSFLLLFLLIWFYSPLQGVGHDYIYVRGTILNKDTNSVKISFEESSTFWDTSDVGPIGGTLELLNTGDTQNYQLQEKVIVKGSRHGTNLAQLDEVTIYPNHFQPFGINWRQSLSLLFIGLTGASIFWTLRQRE